MRQIVLDTETTGLEVVDGHRIIEIACIEMLERCKTGHTWHHYLNPERAVEDGAYEVHGISQAVLQDKPLFSAVADQFIEFIRDSELIIHNASFDVNFIDAELARLGKEWGELADYCKIIDSLKLARELHPGQKNSLDALCQRYRVDNSRRELHGAMLDAELLLDVYLAMTGGQSSLQLQAAAERARPEALRVESGQRSANLKALEPTRAELAAHRQMLALIEVESDSGCLWKE